MDEQDWTELSDAARRGMQRAAVHFVQAAIEVAAGINAFLEELATEGGEETEEGPEQIELD
jgi:hypothetical protein